MFPERQTKQILSVLIIVNLLLAGVFVGVYYLLNNRAANTNELTSRIESIRKQNQQQESINKLAASTDSARNTLDNYFVQPNSSAQFITKIEQIAEETRVDFEIGNVSIQPLIAGEASTNSSGSGESPLFENLTLELRAAGSWGRTIHFVRALELLPERTRLSDVSFGQSSQSGPNESTPPWSVNLTISVIKLTSV